MCILHLACLGPPALNPLKKEKHFCDGHSNEVTALRALGVQVFGFLLILLHQHFLVQDLITPDLRSITIEWA